MFSVLLHDERLAGNTPNMAGTTSFSVGQAEPLDRVLGWVNACHAQAGQIENLLIMCHGYTQNGVGGFGLELAKDDIKLANVSKWSAIQGKVNWIIVYACSTAGVGPSVAAGSHGDGRALCLKLAATTGATVMAATQLQYYHTTTRAWHRRAFEQSIDFREREEIDFGAFEGPVFVFRPDGTVTNVSQWSGSS